MEKGFRTLQCPGCPAKLKLPVAEKDYGTTKVVRCPKCSTQARVEIPYPAPEAPRTGRPQAPSSDSPSQFSWDIFGNIFKDFFQGNKK